MFRPLIVVFFLSTSCCAVTFHTDAYLVSDFSSFPEPLKFLSNWFAPLPDGELGLLIRSRETPPGYAAATFTTELIEDNTAARLTMTGQSGFFEESFWSVPFDEIFNNGWTATHPENNWSIDPLLRHLDVPIEKPFYIGTIFDQEESIGWVELEIDLSDLDSIAPVIVSSAFTYDQDFIVIGDPEQESLPLAGDITEDGFVDASDLNVIGLNWQQSVDGFKNGDITGDGFVDAADLNVVGLEWLRTASPTVPAAVPEPTFRLWPFLLLGLLRKP